jgi:TonB family protein
MNKIKQYYLMAILSIFIINCASTNYQALSKEQIEANAQKYQKDSFHPKRTFAYLKPQVDSITKILNTLINEPQFRNKINFNSLTFMVLPSGKIKTGWFNINIRDSNVIYSYKSYETFKRKYQTDSLLKAYFDSLIQNVKTDSLPEYKPNVCLFGKFKTDSSVFILSFIDSIYYQEPLTGGRSKASIMKVVMENINKLKNAYNQRLREERGLKGKITIKFAINEFGNVIYCIVYESTINDKELENKFVDIIRNWKFKKILKPGDITEVVYPFVLSQ